MSNEYQPQDSKATAAVGEDQGAREIRGCGAEVIKTLRVGMLVMVLVQLLAFTPAASARTGYRHETRTRRYDPSDFRIAAVVPRLGLNAVEFTPPNWARSAEVTVRDDTANLGPPWGAIEFWTEWGSASSEHCSHRGNMRASNGTLRAARIQGRGGRLLVEPLFGESPNTWYPCPVPYFSAPTTGTITVTFLSRVF